MRLIPADRPTNFLQVYLHIKRNCFVLCVATLSRYSHRLAHLCRWTRNQTLSLSPSEWVAKWSAHKFSPFLVIPRFALELWVVYESILDFLLLMFRLAALGTITILAFCFDFSVTLSKPNRFEFNFLKIKSKKNYISDCVFGFHAKVNSVEIEISTICLIRML